MPRVRQRFTPEQRACIKCGASFTANRTTKVYCSKACSRAAAEKYGKCAGCGDRIHRRSTLCGSCGQRARFGWSGGKELVRHTSTPQPKTRVREPKPRRFVSGKCKACGKRIITLGIEWASATCSDECRGRWAKECKKAYRTTYYAKRRAREQETRSEPIYRHKVYAADDHKCYLCGGPLIMSEAVPHPHAPTIDHVKPLAHGGAHTYDNIRAAHFICNSRKSDKSLDSFLSAWGGAGTRVELAG